MASPLQRQTLDKSDPFDTVTEGIGGISTGSSTSTANAETTATTSPTPHDNHTRSKPTSSLSSSVPTQDSTSTTINTSSISIPSSTSSVIISDTSSFSPPNLDAPSTSIQIPPSSSSGTQPAALNLKAQRSHRIAVAAGVAVGLVAFTLVLFAVYMILRRRKRGAVRGPPFVERETTKTYWNLGKQHRGEQSPQDDFFPKEYTGPWTDTSAKARSSPLLI